MNAYTVAYGPRVAAAWSHLAAGWPAEVSGDWLAAEAGRITPHQYVTYVAGNDGWLAAASWLRLTGNEARTGYAMGDLASLDPAGRAATVPCASVVMQGTTQPAVVWDSALTEPELSRVLSTLIAHLIAAARDDGLAGIAVAHVPLDARTHPLRDALRAYGFVAHPQAPGVRMTIPDGGVPAYLAALPPHQRKNCRREMRRFGAAGMSVSSVGTHRLLDDDVVAILQHRYAKYGHQTSTAEVQDRMRRAQGLPGLHMLLVETAEGDAVAFKAFVVDEPLRRLISRLSGCLPNDAYVYFNITFYEPIRHAAALGLTSMVLGTGTYEPKLSRGATLEPLDCFARMVA
jgi:hypothetical protein